MTSTVFVDYVTPVSATWLNDVNTVTYSNGVITGSTADGTTDDTTAIQAAITAAQLTGGIIDGGNRTYAISHQLTIGGGKAIKFQNIHLKAIAGTWPTGTSGFMLNVTAPTNYDDDSHRLENVWCNANSIAKSGFRIHAITAKGSFINCHTFFFSEKGWHVTGPTGNSDCRFIGCTAAERLWTANPVDAFNDYSLRTATAWQVDAADTEYVDCVGYGSYRNLVCDGGFYNAQFTGCKFWSGPVRTGATVVTVELIDAHRCQFSNCRFDDGAVLLHTYDHQFVGNLFIQYNAAAQFRLDAAAANQTANGFVFIGNRFDGSIANPVTLTVVGGGTWASTLNGEWMGNTHADGTVINVNGQHFKSGTVSLVDGGYTFGNGVGAELVSLDGGAANLRIHDVRTGGLARWAWGADNVAEAGANAGSDYLLMAYADAGTWLSTPVTINRATGRIQFSNNVIMKPPSTAVALATNGQVTFEFTSNTQLTIKGRGTDGVTRSVVLTLA